MPERFQGPTALLAHTYPASRCYHKSNSCEKQSNYIISLQWPKRMVLGATPLTASTRFLTLEAICLAHMCLCKETLDPIIGVPTHPFNLIMAQIKKFPHWWHVPMINFICGV